MSGSSKTSTQTCPRPNSKKTRAIGGCAATQTPSLCARKVREELTNKPCQR